MDAALLDYSMSERYYALPTLTQFIDAANEHAALWKAITARAHAGVFDTELLARASRIGRRRRILVLLEDWCGDALNTVPVIDAFIARAANLELRVASRDGNDDLMQRHLSARGRRAIPVAIVYDENFRELGWWGSRPTELQAWVDSPQAVELTRSERYALVRRWYVQDRGVSTVRELLNVLELK